MLTCLLKLNADDAGSVTLEYLALMTLVGLGVVVGAQAMGASLSGEGVEIAQAIVGLDQSYCADGFKGGCAAHAASAASDPGAETFRSRPIECGVTPTPIIAIVSADFCHAHEPGDANDPGDPGYDPGEYLGPDHTHGNGFGPGHTHGNGLGPGHTHGNRAGHDDGQGQGHDTHGH